ncbi:MAG TPA: hypothetical protein VGM54_03230 [Chthoniobacter sp.]
MSPNLTTPPRQAASTPKVLANDFPAPVSTPEVTPAPIQAALARFGEFAPQAAPRLPLNPLPPDWEKPLAEKTANLNPPDRAQAIFQALPSLPPDALGTATHQAVDNLSDQDYSRIVLPVILNPKTPGQVLSPLFADLLDRSAPVVLPTLTNIAATPNHPFAPAALDDLRLLLNADYGTDWTQWEQAVKARLATGLKPLQN